MAPDAWQPFAELIERGDLAGVVVALEALEEPERKRLSKRARELEKAGEPVPVPRTDEWYAFHKRSDARQAIVFGTATAAGAARSRRRPSDAVERLVRCRPREWRQDWAERVMADTETTFWYWPVVHRMVADEEIERPAAVGYLTGAVVGMHKLRDGRLADILR